jgi:hypothetical protein
MTVVQQMLMGEGASSKELLIAKRPPHPFFFVRALCMPSPARGEGKISTKAIVRIMAIAGGA